MNAKASLVESDLLQRLIERWGGVLILFSPADKRQSPADLYMAFAGQYTANSTAHTQITITLLILNVFNSLGDLPLPGR